MAKVYALEVLGTYTQANFDNVAHSLLFAESINCLPYAMPDGAAEASTIVVTSNVESTDFGTDYRLLANDSKPEMSITASAGKFVAGNLIAVLCTSAEAEADLRDYVTYFATTGDIHLHIGVCNSTQSQDYTPDIITNNRVRKMVTPEQVQTLGL